MKYLFLLTISPVQTFIEQARKTQDLKAGSQILSDLITFAIQEVEDNTISSDLIFPAKKILSKPNRFITILETKENMQEFGDNLKTKIQVHFLKEAKKLLKDTGFFENCKKQLEDYFKIYWVAKKYYDDKSYEDQHEILEGLLGAVKANRPFKQLEEKGRKCSINGELNVKFYRKTSDETKNKREVKGNKRKLFHSDVFVIEHGKQYAGIQRKDLDSGEGLCSISFLKRKWELELYKLGDESEKIKTKSFPSIPEIALLNILNKIEEKDPKLRGKINVIKDVNDQFFYDENITEKEYERIEDIAQTNGVPKDLIAEYQKEIANAAKYYKVDDKLKPLQLSKYYAILVFDADDMGNALKGKSKEYQKDLSKCLGDFAELATNYIDGFSEDKTQKGKTVYAGGDDFLGFINLDYLFEAMQWLRENFDIVINKEMEKKHESPNLSFSAGIAIAHYKTPLSEVLHWARASEKLAKKKYKDTEKKKNAFCLSVLKHSGEIHQTTWKWSYKEDLLTDTLTAISTLLNKLINEELSSKFIKSLDSEFRKLVDENGDINDDNEEALSWELKRLILRATTVSNNFQKGDAKKIAQSLSNLRNDDNDCLGGKHNLESFIQLLEIIDFLHRHVNFTIPQPEKELV